jgi:hypothetical protein
VNAERQGCSNLRPALLPLIDRFKVPACPERVALSAELTDLSCARDLAGRSSSSARRKHIDLKLRLTTAFYLTDRSVGASRSPPPVHAKRYFFCHLMHVCTSHEIRAFPCALRTPRYKCCSCSSRAMFASGASGAPYFGAPMTMLPKPFIHQVLASLTNVADLCNALLVCTEWRDVGRSGALWRFMFLKLHGAPTATERGLRHAVAAPLAHKGHVR